MTRRPFVSFIIVTYNSDGSIQACLRSITARTTDTYEIVIVDNSPNNHTASAIRHFMEMNPHVLVRLVEAGQNLGFGKACNAGALLASGQFLFFLNPDTELINDAAKVLTICFETHSRTMAAGPAIFNESGVITRTCRNLPSLLRILLDSTGLDRWFGAYKLTRFDHVASRQVEQIIGAAMLIRRSDYERLGGMDERFFIYFEEVDLCKRMREAGGEIRFWPEAKVQHVGGASCEVASVRARMIYILRESRRKYFKKHFGIVAGWMIELINRLEGFEKSAALGVLWLLRRRQSYLEKAYGFWSVATGVAPRV